VRFERALLFCKSGDTSGNWDLKADNSRKRNTWFASSTANTVILHHAGNRHCALFLGINELKRTEDIRPFDLHYGSELNWSGERFSTVKTILCMSSRLGHAVETEKNSIEPASNTRGIKVVVSDSPRQYGKIRWLQSCKPCHPSRPESSVSSTRRGPCTLIDRQDITELVPAENHKVYYRSYVIFYLVILPAD
jgi:hypothetical protein